MDLGDPSLGQDCLHQTMNFLLLSPSSLLLQRGSELLSQKDQQDFLKHSVTFHLLLTSYHISHDLTTRSVVPVLQGQI